MKKLLFYIILAVFWLGVIYKWQMRKDARREAKPLLPGQHGEWGTECCNCGTPRREWESLGVNRENFTLLLKCRECGQLWEEKLEGKAVNKWREVDREHAGFYYNFD